MLQHSCQDLETLSNQRFAPHLLLIDKRLRGNSFRKINDCSESQSEGLASNLDRSGTFLAKSCSIVWTTLREYCTRPEIFCPLSLFAAKLGKGQKAIPSIGAVHMIL
jgi:hypothetical protein